MYRPAVIIFLIGIYQAFLPAVWAAVDNEKKSYPLALPQNTSDSASDPVEYTITPPGEFKDVDLPDDIKKSKYHYLARTDKTNSEIQQGKKFTRFSIQVAMFKNRDNADRMLKELEANHLRVEIIERNDSLGQPRYFVRVGHYKSHQQAQEALDLYNKTASYKAFIVKE